jgi:hypothetical protein
MPRPNDTVQPSTFGEPATTTCGQPVNVPAGRPGLVVVVICVPRAVGALLAPMVKFGPLVVPLT